MQWKQLVNWQRRSLVYLLLVGLIQVGFIEVAQAEDYVVSANTPVVNCKSLGISPGDTITFAAGSRGNISFVDCFGTSFNKITIRNNPNSESRTTIEATGDGGFRGIDCKNCEHVVFDGTQKWNNAPAGICGIDRSTRAEGRTQCGIRIFRASGSPTTLFILRGSSKDVTVKGVEIDGNKQSSGSGIGMFINDRYYSKSNNPGEWRENFRIENNYFHDTHHEGIYAGPNYNHSESVDDLELRNIEFSFNLVEDTGWGGLQIKTAVEGENSIHHNHFYRAGWKAAKENDSGHAICAMMDGSTGAIYSNYFHDCAGFGIAYRMQYLPSTFGQMFCEIYNNVISRPGSVKSAHGITVWRPSTEQASPKCVIVNNTIVNSMGTGIGVASNISGTTISDNIVVGSLNSHISASSASNAISNNLTGSTDSAGFVDTSAFDFRLASDSLAIDRGMAKAIPNDDYSGVPRPQGKGIDQGAFEFTLSAGSSKPNPPEFTQIQ